MISRDPHDFRNLPWDFVSHGLRGGLSSSPWRLLFHSILSLVETPDLRRFVFFFEKKCRGYVRIAMENGHRYSVIFPIKHGDFPQLCESLPEGICHGITNMLLKFPAKNMFNILPPVLRCYEASNSQGPCLLRIQIASKWFERHRQTAILNPL